MCWLAWWQLFCSLAIVAVIAPSLRGQAAPVIDNVYAGIGFNNIVAPGEVINLDGTNLAGPSGSATPTVLVNGVSAPVYVNTCCVAQGGIFLEIEVPPQTPTGPANIVVSVNGISSSPFQVMVQPYTGYVEMSGGYAYAYRADGSSVTQQSPAKVGETISVVVTGLGVAVPSPPVAVSLGGFSTAVESIQPIPFAVPGFESLTFAVPASLSSGDQTIVMTVGKLTSGGPILIPVVATGLILSQTGATFQAVAGSATIFQQSVFIIAANQVTNWTAMASTISGGNWLQVTPASGTSDPAQSPPSIEISASAQNLAPGSYYGQVTVSPVNSSSAQTITAVLNVLPAGHAPGPSLQPTGLLFTSTAGAAFPSAQTTQITNPSTVTLEFSGTASVPSGTPWFQFSPESGTVAPGAPVTITVQPSTSLPSGIYAGSVGFDFSDGGRKVLSLLWVVTSTGGVSGSSRKPSRSGPLDTTTCTPTQLVPLFTLLGVNFSSPVAWPSPIEASIVDNCGNPMNSGSVALSFSNGDPALGMSPLQDGTWTATWTPINPVTSSLVVTLTAQLLSPPIQGTTQVSGSAPANPLVPIVNSGGVVSTADYVASPAPGTLISVFGTELAGSTEQAKLPLPNQLGTTQLAIGGVIVPLLFVNATQINALVPYGLQTNANYTIIVQRGNAISTAQTISVQEAQPSVFTPDPSGKGQGYIFKLASDGSEILAAPGSPVTGGDVVVIYCEGLGEVQPQLLAGMPAPLTTLEYTVNPVTATIGGVSAKVEFGGLTPGFAGLYQVNLTVPSGITPGDSVPLLLSVAGESSLPVTMAVH